MTIARETEELNIQLGVETVKQTTLLKYLGAVIDEKGDMEGEINNRIGAATRLYNALNRILISKREVSKLTKMKIYESVFVPVLTYGCESWVLSERQKSKLQACEMRYLRRAEGVTKRDRIRNEEIRNRLGAEQLQRKIERHQLRWFGHLVRMNGTRRVKVLWEMGTDRRRTRGRARNSWNGEVAKALEKKGSNWTLARRVALDRNRWRAFCR